MALELWLISVCLLKSAACSVTIDLPFEHVPFYFNFYPQVAQESEQNPDCDLKVHLHQNVCWGYEPNCGLNPRSYSHPLCDGDSKGWAKTKQEQIDTFYHQADFGYVKNFRKSLEHICIPHNNNKESSSLECSENLTFCRGRNLMIDFGDLTNRKSPVMYDTDVLSAGQIKGYCSLDKERLKANMHFNGSLQTWVPEIQHFAESSQPIRTKDKGGGQCDKIIRTPTIIIKIDATVNMYHHFCDFFNLYATLHVNATPENPEAFGRNNQIFIWRTFKYQSNFEETFKAFTKNRILDLNSVAGRKVCFKNVIFPLLPRMIFGLYYNTPLIWGCRNSGMFHAFSKFIVHRLRVETRATPDPTAIRITFLSRQTAYRNVLNEDELLDVLRQNPALRLQKVTFNHRVDFRDQLKIIQETDILIGIHGAGLTHLLFLPDWAVIFELYHCEDPNCYADLARLRGLKYLTWRDPSKLRYQDINPDVHSTYFQKHANYLFDEKEFVNIVADGIKHVKDQAAKVVRDEL